MDYSGELIKGKYDDKHPLSIKWLG